MAATTWFDSMPVIFLSTSTDPITPGPPTCKRCSHDNVHATPQQLEYSENMKGVDVVDQMRKDYNCQFHSFKWWHKMFFFVLDSSLQNSWVLFQKHILGRPEKLGLQKQFYYRIAQALIQTMFPLPRSVHVGGRNPNVLHFPQSHRSLARRCIHCRRKQNSFYRAYESVFICQTSCYVVIHS